MSSPIYSVELTGKNIDGSSISCTGKHLEIVLEELNKHLKSAIWFGCDVNVSNDNTIWRRFSSYDPKYIGENRDFIELLDSDEQFLSGVFLIAPKGKNNKWAHEYETEDEPFRNNEGALIELRTFDTSHIELYTSDKELLSSLSKRFTCVIKENN